MSDFPRYAIYYVPDAGSPLARFGAGLLGYDPATGHDVAFPAEVVAQVPDWPTLTNDPRKYGFHGTLKAPFPLATSKTEAELVATCMAFAATPRAIPVTAPVVRTISGFTAVVPSEPSTELNALAQACVEAFDDFRAPMTADDRARRKPENLTARQIEQLDRFGYPYVRDDFRFHLTLTGRLPAERTAPVRELLQQRFAKLAMATLAIDRIALLHQPAATARFQVLRAFTLTPG
jgi:putative phosphonate metabolism protein